MNQVKDAVREASPSDIVQLVSLINRAFAVERFFKNADRTNPEQVRENMNEGTFLLLHEGNELVSCIWIKRKDKVGYLGLLAVDPLRQRCGLGSRMMREAEEYCRAAGCKALDIRIVNVRTELPAIYRKFGFVESGTESAAVIKSATQPIHFITMSKAL